MMLTLMLLSLVQKQVLGGKISMAIFVIIVVVGILVLGFVLVWVVEVVVVVVVVVVVAILPKIVATLVGHGLPFNLTIFDPTLMSSSLRIGLCY